jgi:hypothetical protein
MNFFQCSRQISFLILIGALLSSLSTRGQAAEQSSESSQAQSSITPDLWRDLGVSASLLGGGRGHVSDASAADRNPAGLALQKTYTVSGDLGWIGQKARLAEASACDSSTSDLAACFKFRQTQKITGARDRRFSLAIAEALGNGLIVGLAGDYVQFAEERVSPATPVSYKTGQRLRLGAIYPLADGLFAGLTGDGLYDSTGTDKSFGVGLSAQLGPYFLMSGDLRFNEDTLKEMVGGVSVFPRNFLDFAVSYGYDPKASQHRIGAGVVVKSQQARLIYSMVRSSEQPAQIFQTFGIGLYMAGDASQR